MIWLHSFLKSCGRIIAFRYEVKSLLNYPFISKNVRLFATETTVMKISNRTSIKKNTRLQYILSWCILVIPIGSFGLGTWQVFRKFEKDKWNAEFLEALNQPPVELPKDLNELEYMEYRKIKVRGKFDYSKEFYFGPRSKIDEYSDKNIPSLLSLNKGGYFVVTPFILSDRNLTILINRGWVPKRKHKGSAQSESALSDEIELVGLVRHQENSKICKNKNLPEKNIWVTRDIYEMSKTVGAAPVFLDADKESTVPGGPVGGQTFVNLKNDHQSYVFVWYTLSAVSGYMWFNQHFRRIPILV